MTGRGRSRWERILRLTTRAMQAFLAATVGYALLQASAGMVVNAGIPLLIAMFPDAVRHWYGYRLDPVLAAWIATAALLHVIGSLGAYTAVPIFDQIAHGVSASVVAGVGYALVRVIERGHDRIEIPAETRFAFVVVFVISFGVVWEVAEFASGRIAALLGGEALLAQYGLDDIVMDQVFNAAGAVVVALWGTEYFTGVRRVIADRLRSGTGD